MHSTRHLPPRLGWLEAAINEDALICFLSSVRMGRFILVWASPGAFQQRLDLPAGIGVRDRLVETFLLKDILSYS